MSAVDKIVCAPDDRLKTECEPIDQITDEIKSLADEMLDAMYATDGCGLAAPQLGVTKQIVVIDVDHDAGKHKNPYVLINPKVVTADGEKRDFSEGCLSFPGISVTVSRPSHVVVEAQNLEGDTMRYEAEGNLMAVCLQHEIDHLHGITMVDHLSPLKRMRAMREYEDAVAAGATPGETAVD